MSGASLGTKKKSVHAILIGTTRSAGPVKTVQDLKSLNLNILIGKPTVVNIAGSESPFSGLCLA